MFCFFFFWEWEREREEQTIELITMILIRSFQVVTIAEKGADCFPKTVFVWLLCPIIQKSIRYKARISSIFHILHKYEKSIKFQKLCFVLKTKMCYSSSIKFTTYTNWNHGTANTARIQRSCNSLETSNNTEFTEKASNIQINETA